MLKSFKTGKGILQEILCKLGNVNLKHFCTTELIGVVRVDLQNTNLWVLNNFILIYIFNHWNIYTQNFETILKKNFTAILEVTRQKCFCVNRNIFFTCLVLCLKSLNTLKRLFMTITTEFNTPLELWLFHYTVNHFI